MSTRAKNVAVVQYVSIKSALERTLGPEPEKLHSIGKISERAGLTRQPSLFQGPSSRHRIYWIKVRLQNI
jgi:hypothetical protein